MIFNTSYALSNVPHLHRVYVIGRCVFFWLAVSHHTEANERKAYANNCPNIEGASF